MHSKKIDICAYDGPDQVGGPYVWIQRLPDRLRKMGFDVRVHLFSWQAPEDGCAFRTLRRQGITARSTLFRDTETNVRWLLRGAEESKPDVFIANHVIPAFYAARYLKESGVKTVGILRSDDRFYRAIAERFVFKQGPFQLSEVVCVSDYLLQTVTQRLTGPVHARKIPSGTPIPPVVTVRNSQLLKIAYVGRLVEEQKQVTLLTHALIKVIRECKNVEVTMYGDGPARRDLEQIISESGTSQIRLAGGLSSAALQESLLKTHVVVLLSDYEGNPTAVMEAMACGCVPVCLNIRSGVPELVEDGVTGLLVDDRGKDFVHAIQKLETDRALWQKLSINARAHIEKNYSVANCAAKWAKLINTPVKPVPASDKFISPKSIRLPATSEGFAHQDWRQPGKLETMTKYLLGHYRRTRIQIGRVRRQLLGKPAA